MHRDFLLFIGLQVTGGLGLAPQTLHRVHHVVGLGEEGITHALYPGRVLAKGGEHLRESHQGLNAGVPGLVGHLLHRGVAAGVGVGLGPGHGVGHIAGIGGGHQHLGQEGVRVEGQRRHHLVEFFGFEHGLARLWLGGGWRGGFGCGGDAGGGAGIVFGGGDSGVRGGE
ncbi:hypothetical protein D9M71_425150 [compost metagenome]